MSTAIKSDIMNIKALPPYDIVYTDPPWEQRMVKQFETIMKKATGEEAQNDINAILLKLADLCSTQKPVYVEYSVAGSKRVVICMEKAGHVLNEVSLQTQSVGRPFVVMSFNTSKKLPSGLKGHEVIRKVIELENPETVADPFAGIGAFAKTFHKQGVEYIGYEINGARYDKLKTIVDKHNDNV